MAMLAPLAISMGEPAGIGGEIALQSTEGAGSEFMLRLPLNEQENPI